MSKKVKGKKYLNVFHIRWVFFLAVSVIIGGIMSFGLVAYLVFGFKNNTAIHMLWMIPLMTITIAGALLIVLHFMEKRLSKLMNAIHEVSGGNLDVEIDLNDAQEYEVVYKDFNKMVKELRLTKQEMQNTVNEIAHEFKTPITSICGFADYLYQTGGEIETEERLGFLKLISDQAGRLSNLSQNMLLLSKLEACQIMTDKRMFDVAEQINKCIILFLEQLDKKNIEMRIDRIIADGKCRFAIYPYGEIGRYAEEYLNKRHGINIEYAIDNNTCDGHHVLSLQEIDPKKDVLYLICSRSPQYYWEIRREIYRVLDKSKIIDLFEYNEDNLWYRAYQNFAMRSSIYDATYDNDDRIHDAKYTAMFWSKKYIHVSEDDILVGNVAVGRDYPYKKYGIGNQDDIKALFYTGLFSEKERNEFLNAVSMGLICRNPGVHATAAYSMIISEGIAPRIKYVDQRINNDKSDKAFYKAEKIVLDGFLNLISRYADEAQRQYAITRRKNLKVISENCRELLKNAPSSLLQGLQLVLFIHLGIVMENGCGSFSFGRIDQYLYPLYCF